MNKSIIYSTKIFYLDKVIFIFLLLVMLHTNSSGQEYSFQVGNGTYLVDLPFLANHTDSRTQILVRADEISALGITPGEKITKIGFIINNSGFNEYDYKASFYGRAALTNVNELTEYLDLDGASGDRFGRLDMLNEDNQALFPLNLTWDGVSNIVIEVYSYASLVIFEEDPCTYEFIGQFYCSSSYVSAFNSVLSSAFDDFDENICNNGGYYSPDLEDGIGYHEDYPEQPYTSMDRPNIIFKTVYEGSQSQVQFGDQTTSSNTNGASPYEWLNGDYSTFTRSEYIITANELYEQNIGPGIISDIGFKVANGDYNDYDLAVWIFISHTNKYSYSNYDDFEINYSNTSASYDGYDGDWYEYTRNSSYFSYDYRNTFNDNTWYTYDAYNYFQWNGVDNIVISVMSYSEITEAGYYDPFYVYDYSFYQPTVYYSTTPFNSVLYKTGYYSEQFDERQSDFNLITDPDYDEGYASNTRPNIKITGSYEPDRNALMTLYYATQGGLDWDITRPSSAWSGITKVNNNVTEIDISGQNLKGDIPGIVATIPNLTYFNASNNNIAELDFGDLTGTTATFDVSNNRLHFDDIEPNYGQPNFIYQNQKPVEMPDVIEINEGGSLDIPLYVGGSSNIYSWYHNGTLVGTSKDLHIDQVLSAGAGMYYCEITSGIVLDLTIETEQIEVIVNDSPLYDFYLATGGDNWTSHGSDNWLSNLPYDQWLGVATDAEGNVTNIVLPDNNLVGTIPPAIGQLSYFLMEIDISGNPGMGGDIPSQFFNDLVALKSINFNGCNFNGSFSDFSNNLYELEELKLSGNSFSGTIDASINGFEYLSTLDISNNSFNGSLPIDGIWLPYLENINIEGNQFDELPDLTTLVSLTELKVANNKLTFEDLEPNKQFFLSASDYAPQATVEVDPDSYTVDEWTKNFEILISVGGSNNMYHFYKDGASYEGPSPSPGIAFEYISRAAEGPYHVEITNTNPELSGLVLTTEVIQLEVIEDDTRPGGVSIDQFNALTAFYNATNGDNWTNNDNWLDPETHVSFWYGITFSSPPDIIDVIALENNNLTGTLPCDLEVFTGLIALVLSDNAISGEIPGCLGNIGIEYLLLGNNGFTGQIPVGLFNNTSFEELDLSNNQLEGTVPSEIKNLYAYMIDLSGNILSELPYLHEPGFPELNIQDNKFTFEDIEPNIALYQPLENNYDYYSPQKTIELAQTAYNLDQWDYLSLSVPVGGVDNIYQWYKNGQPYGDPSDAPGLIFDYIGQSDAGTYYLEITNTTVEYLTLVTEDIIVTVNPRPDLPGGVTQQDYDALEAFYYATDGDNWTLKDNWLDPQKHVNKWTGLTAANERVSEIELSGNNLNGNIPPEIGDLTQLTHLIVGDNSLGTALVSEISSCTNLTVLNLQNSGFAGVFQNSIASCTNLQNINLSNNQLEGIPDLSGLASLSSYIVANNKLTFEDLEPNISQFSGSADYSPQALINYTHVKHKPKIMEPYAIDDIVALGVNNQYQWFKDGSPINGKTSLILDFESVSMADESVNYVLRVTNSLVPVLILETPLISLVVDIEYGCVTEADYNALLAFYAATNGDNWDNNLYWGNPGVCVGDWAGVTMENERVTKIELPGNNLVGTIPPEIGDLTQLTHLVVGNNSLGPSLVSDISSCTNLTVLELQGNSFTGVFQNSITSCINLQTVNLSNNQLEGIPDLSGLSSLNSYIVDNNKLTFEDLEPNISQFSGSGDYSPQALINYTHLIHQAPAWASYEINDIDVGGGTDNLYQWYKSEDEIVGKTSSILYFNYVTISDEYDHYVLKVTNNIVPGLTLKTPDIALDVIVNPDRPAGITQADFDALEAFYIATTGPSWTDDEYWLNEEIFAGDWAGVTVENERVTKIELSGNNLDGNIPPEIGDLTQLTHLVVGNNSLGSSLVAEISSCAYLTVLELQGNGFTGVFQNSIASCTNLQTVNLSNNQLEGIPDLSGLSSLNSYIVANNKLTFEDLEPNSSKFTILTDYAPQALIEVPDSYSGPAFEPFVIDNISVGGSNNIYQWYIDYDPEADQAVTTDPASPNLAFDPLMKSDENTYYLQITSDITALAGLTLQTENISLVVSESDIYPAGIIKSDYDALVALYNATQGDNWTNHTYWKDAYTPAGDWFGVTTVGQRVTEVRLPLNNLDGSIPALIGNLTAMTHFIAGYNNNLSGPLPAEMSGCSALTELQLNNCALNGQISPAMVNCSNLQVFDISFNEITQLPNLSALPNITNFDVSDNALTFEDLEPNVDLFSHPEGLDYSPQADIVVQNQYNVPAWEPFSLSVTTGGQNNIYQWYKGSSALDQQNQDELNFDPLMKENEGIYYLEINNGTNGLGELTLRTVNIEVTVESNENIAGGVTRADFEALSAFYDATNGDFWSDNTNWKNEFVHVNNWKGVNSFNNRVTEIQLANNNLTGYLPGEIGNLTALRRLELTNNGIAQAIPASIGALSGLNHLYLDNNDFSGDIPLAIGNCTQLNGLLLNNNQLSGSVPSQLTSLNNLLIFDLSYNKLVDLPDVSLSALPAFNIHHNRLTFEDLVPNTNILDNPDYYSPQEAIVLDPDEYNKTEGQQLVVTLNVGGGNNEYQWVFFGQDLGQTQSTGDLVINSLIVADAGPYYCVVTNPDVPGLVFETNQVTVTVESDNSLVGGVSASDYQALVALYNSTSGQSWDNDLNWLIIDDNTSVDDWYGVEVENGRVVAVNLPGNLLEGQLPLDMRNLDMLEIFDVSDNQLTGSIPEEMNIHANLQLLNIEHNSFDELPDFSAIQPVPHIMAAYNNFTFEDLEPNTGSFVSVDDYSPQAELTIVPSKFFRYEGESFSYLLDTGGDNNIYSWQKNDLGAWAEISADALLQINTVDFSTTGEYKCVVTNPDLPGLALQTNIIEIGILDCAMGDIDCDDLILTFDAALLMNYLADNNLEVYDVPAPPWDGQQVFYRADVDLNDLLQAQDAYYIFNHALLIEPVLPVILTKAGKKNALVQVLRAKDKLIFSATGELVAFELDADVPRGLTLGQPEFTGMSLDVSNTANGTYKALAISSEGIGGSARFLEIPVSGEFDGTLTLNMTVNTAKYVNRVHFSTSSIDEPADTRPIINVYPNPFKETTNFAIDLPYPAKVELQVFDALGRMVFAKTTGSNENVQGQLNWQFQVNQGHSNSLFFYRFTINEQIITGTVLHNK